jgi:hypothetical protein
MAIAISRVHGGHGAARAGGREVAQGPERTGRPHREQPGGELRRQPDLVGRFVTVRITEAFPNSLRGDLLGLAEHKPDASAANWG